MKTLFQPVLPFCSNLYRSLFSICLLLALLFTVDVQAQDSFIYYYSKGTHRAEVNYATYWNGKRNLFREKINIDDLEQKEVMICINKVAFTEQPSDWKHFTFLIERDYVSVTPSNLVYIENSDLPIEAKFRRTRSNEKHRGRHVFAGDRGDRCIRFKIKDIEGKEESITFSLSYTLVPKAVGSPSENERGVISRTITFTQTVPEIKEELPKDSIDPALLIAAQKGFSGVCAYLQAKSDVSPMTLQKAKGFLKEFDIEAWKLVREPWYLRETMQRRDFHKSLKNYKETLKKYLEQKTCTDFHKPIYGSKAKEEIYKVRKILNGDPKPGDDSSEPSFCEKLKTGDVNLEDLITQLESKSISCKEEALRILQMEYPLQLTVETAGKQRIFNFENATGLRYKNLSPNAGLTINDTALLESSRLVVNVEDRGQFKLYFKDTYGRDTTVQFSNALTAKLSGGLDSNLIIQIIGGEAPFFIQLYDPKTEDLLVELETFDRTYILNKEELKDISGPILIKVAGSDNPQRPVLAGPTFIGASNNGLMRLFLWTLISLLVAIMLFYLFRYTRAEKTRFALPN